MHGRVIVIDDSVNLSGPHLDASKRASSSQNLVYKIWEEYRTTSGTSNLPYRFPVCCYVLKRRRLKSDWVLEAIFRTFYSCKN